MFMGRGMCGLMWGGLGGVTPRLLACRFGRNYSRNRSNLYGTSQNHYLVISGSYEKSMRFSVMRVYKKTVLLAPIRL